MQDDTNPYYSEVTEGDKVTRTFLRMDYNSEFEGGYPFSKGDVATYKKKGKWILNLHSFDDEPAISFAGGTKLWFLDGREGRLEGLPCKEYASGAKVWIDHTNGQVQKVEK